MFRRVLLLVVLAAAVLGVLVQPAFAHVTVQPGEATQGGYTKLTFRVPNEEESAATIKLEVELPSELQEARTKPVPGWTATVADGRITWDGGRVEPGEFQEFDISVGPLPKVDELVFKALQTYDNGEVVRWIELPADGDEPEHPAPVLKLVAASGSEVDAAPAPEDGTGDDSGNALAVVALIVGALGFVVGGIGLARSGRR